MNLLTQLRESLRVDQSEMSTLLQVDVNRYQMLESLSQGELICTITLDEVFKTENYFKKSIHQLLHETSLHTEARSQKEIIEKIREVATQTSYKRIWLFGSVARNEHDQFSDIDIIVEKDHEHFKFKDEALLHSVLVELSNHEFNDILNTEQLENIKQKGQRHLYDKISHDKILIYERKDLSQDEEISSK